MKYYVLFLLVLGLFLSCDSPKKQDQPDNTLKDTIIEIMTAYNNKDASTINNFIHPKYGLTVLFRGGAIDQFQITQKIDFDHPIPNYSPYEKINTNYEVSFDKLPVFDVGMETWTKTGLFCHDDNQKQLSKVVKGLTENEIDEVSKETIEKFNFIENNSKRIVFIDEGEGAKLIYILTKIEGKWYLSVLDRLTGDIGA